MAESNNRVRIDFDVNAEELKEITQAINILDKFNKQASQVTGALGALTGSMNNNNKATKAQKDSYVNLDKAMDAWANRLQTNQSRMASYEASQAKLTEKLKAYGRDVKVSVDQTGKLAATFKNAEGNIVSMTGKYDLASNSIKEMKTNLSTASLEVKKKMDADKKAAQEMDRLHTAALKVNKGIDEQARKYKELTRGTDLSRVLKANGNAFDVLNNSVKLNGQVVRGSMDRNGKFTQTIRDQDGTLRSISGYYDKVNKKLVQYSEAVSRSASSTKALGSAMNGSGRELTNLEQSMKGLNKYTLSWADAIEIAGTRMLQWNIAGAAIFGMQNSFKALIDLVFQLDEQMTQLKRVMPDTTNFNEMMEDSIRLSTELGRTITDINEALISFARSGFNNVDTRFLSEAATLMANVSDIDVGDAAETLTSALTLFNVKARDSIQVVNKLNEVDNDYSVSTEQLAKSITRAGGTAASFGVDLNELIGHTTAIGVATRESGQIIGNSLKTIYSRVNTLPKAAKAIESLGVAMKMPNGDNRDVADIMDDLAKKWPELNNAQKQNTAIAVAGTHQLSRFLAMMNNYQMGLDATKTAQNSYNSAVKENEKFMVSLAAKLNLMKASFQQLGMALGEAGLYKAIGATLVAINNMTQGAVKIVDVLGKWTFVIPLAVAALGAFVVVFQKTKAEMLTFQIAMATMNTSMSRSALAMTANATASGIFTTALGTMRTAVLGLTAAALTNPFTWIALAVVAIPMLIGHFQRLKAEQEALHKKAEDNTLAYKAFLSEIKNGDVSQTSLDTFTAKTDVAGKALKKLTEDQKEVKKNQELMKIAMTTSYDGGMVAMQQYGNWQDTISKKTKDELADIGIKFDKYKTIEDLMAAVKTRQKEYSEAVGSGNSILEEAQKKLMFHADAFEEVGEEVEETMDIMKLFFGVNDQMIQELVGSYNSIQVLTKVKEKDAAQTEALNQAIEVWTAKTGLSREELLKNPAAMKEVIKSHQEMADKWGEKTQEVLSAEEAKRLAVDVTTQKVKDRAAEQLKAEKEAADKKAKAAEEEAKRKGAAFQTFREEMDKSKKLGLEFTAKEVSNNVLRGKSGKETAEKTIKALTGEDRKTKSTTTAYTDMKNMIVENNGKRKTSTGSTAININKSLVSEDKQAGKTATGHKDAATKVSNAAKTKKEQVLSNASAQNSKHKSLSNDETKSVSSGWSNMWNTVSKILGWIKGLFGIKGGSKAGSTKGSMKANGIDRYATGTSASGHPADGLAIVSEKGRELIHDPKVGTYLSGSNGPELKYLSKGSSVLPNHHTEKVLKSHGFPGYAGGVGDFFDAITKGPKAVWESGVSKFGLSDSMVPSWFNGLTGSPVKAITGMAIDGVQGLLDKAMGSFSSGSFSGGGSKMAQAAIMQALKITGKPMSWLGPMMTIAQKESGFNPRAINNWDINAKRGDPSVGLFQIINSTFRAHMLKGMGDRTNPLHSAVAAIRYMDSRYGGIWGHPGVKSMAGGGGYKPYANGGIINKPHMGLVGEAGPEAIIPLSSNKRSRAMELYEQTGQALGVRPYANGGIVGGTTKYKIKSGDTLSELAVHFKTTVKNLMEMNKQIKNANKIYAGRYLTIKKGSGSSSSAPKKPKYTQAQADAKFQSTNDYVGYMQGMNAKGYDTAGYKTWKLRSIEGHMKYASTDNKKDYNKQMAQALSGYTNVNNAKKRFNEAEWYGLSKQQKTAVWEGIKAEVVANTIESLNASTTKWLDSFNEGLTKANQKVTDWLSLADSMKQKQASMKKDAYIDSYVTKGMDKYGMIEKKTGAEATQARMDEIKQKTESLLADNAEITYQNDPKEFAKRKAQLDKEQKTIQDKINSVTADAKKQGLTASQYSNTLTPLKDKLKELNDEEAALAAATKTNDGILKANGTTISSLGKEYEKLQKELEETTKKTEMLDMIKEKVTSLFSWDANSLYTQKTDEFGNVVRDIEGTIRSVLDVQKAIEDITAGIYENIDKTVEEMITSILTTELPDIGSLFGAEGDYSGIATGLTDAIGTIKPTWDATLTYMSSSMMGMFSGSNFQDVMKDWTKNMAISMDGLQPLFENLMVKFPEVIGKVMSDLPNLVYAAMKNLTVGVFNSVVEVLNRLVATVNQIVPAGSRAPLFEQMGYATPTYTQNNETNNEQKVYQTGGVERNVTYIVNTGVAIASESELREFAMILKEMMDEEEGRGKS